METNEKDYLRQYFHHHLDLEVEMRVDERITEMGKYPDRADRISKITFLYVKENILDYFCQTMGFLFILDARFEVGLPLLNDIVENCYENVRNITNSILKHNLEMRINMLLGRYATKEEPLTSQIYCTQYFHNNVLPEVKDHFDQLVVKMKEDTSKANGIFWEIFLYVKDNVNDPYCHSLLLLFLIGELEIVDVHVLLRVMHEVDKNMVQIYDNVLYKDLENQFFIVKHG